MAEALENKKLQQLLKKHPGESGTFYANELGIAVGKIAPLLYYNEPLADPSLKFSGTPAQIVNARENDGLRWERIAARTGLSLAEVRRRYEEKTGNSYQKSYSGRGRRFDGSAPKSGGKTSTAKGRGGSGQKSGTSGRRQAAAGRGKATATATAAAGKGRAAGRGGARTRAEAKGKGRNPS
jgi:hypothetical protein